jgi:hypothetical protein
MEIFPYLLNVILFAFAIYWSAANGAAKPGTPTFGLFRYRETTEDAPKPQPAGIRRLMLK